MPVYPPVPPVGLGYGGASYAYSPYGGGAFPRQPIPPSGGYGGASYAYSSYGSLDSTPPRVSSVVSIDAYTVEVYFSEEIRDDAALTDPVNYVFASVNGVPLTTSSITGGTAGDHGGYTTVLVTHSGSTLGGKYTLTVSNLSDIVGNNINLLSSAARTGAFLSYGEAATYTVTPVDGTTLEVAFFRPGTAVALDMLTEAEFTPGIEQVSAYEIATDYPVNMVVETVTHPVGGDASLAMLTVSAQTSANYNVSISPAAAIEYDGSYLPSAATEFTGVEVGTGSSAAGAVTGLVLTKGAGVLYGWAFQDDTGKVTGTSSYRLDAVLDPSTALYVPALYDTALASLSFADGVTQVDITLARVAGIDIIQVSSGAYSSSFSYAWSTGPFSVTLIRNQKAGNFAILINGVPMVSEAVGSFTGIPAISPGAQLLLASAYAISGFTLTSIEVTSSQTVFTSAWNFLHGVSGSFTGSSMLANDRLLTQRGPLVKGWGDATPATAADVEVRVNGVAVDIDTVNPYTGTIYPAIPIPRTTPGTVTVEVDYKWFPAPQFELAGLNTPGLILNKWDLPRGHTAGAVSPTPSTATGAIDTARFPMAIVLGPEQRILPVEIGHRYMGFEREYTAALNSPTTLLLNQNPHRVSVPGLESSCSEASAYFDGNSVPTSADPAWELDGTDSGSIQGDGTYLLVDESSGSYGAGTAAVYYREENFTCQSTVRLTGRLKVSDYELDGVFTGVGFGFHDNFRLYLAGLLEVNGLKHVGLLKNASAPHEEDSWEIGPAVTVTITSENTFTVDSTVFPSVAEPGSSLQILTGNQAGTYTIAECGIDDYDGTVTVVITGSFPADISQEGNDTATVVFEVDWESVNTTFRMVAVSSEDDAERSVELYVGGSLTEQAVTLTGTEVSALPADTALLIPTGDKGRIMWGSFSREATNSTRWSLCRYSLVPDSLTASVRGIVVATEMSDLPEQDSNHEWFFTNRFGYSEIDGTGDTMLLKSTSADPLGVLDLTYGYARLEPSLTNKVFADVDGHFKVESGILGAGDATLLVRDTVREVGLTTLVYKEGYGTGDYRRLVEMPSASLSGLLSPTAAGWTVESGNTLNTPTVRGQQFTLDKSSGDAGFWATSLGVSTEDSGARIIEARLAVTAYSPSSGFGGPTWGAHVGSGPFYDVRVALGGTTPSVRLLDSTGAIHATFAFDFTDGEFHTYRVIANPTVGTVVLIIDDVTQGSVALPLFAAVANNLTVRVGAQGSSGSSTSVWDSFHVHALPVASVKRTLGVYVSGSRTSIDSYAVPRTDSTDADNSEAGATIQEMDWTSYVQVRVHLDQTWGVSIYRPDLAPPPWFTGDFTTRITDPTAAWINVEYGHLPTHADAVGRVSFGALDPRSITQQRWKELRYRLYNTPTEDYIAPQGMVLNRYNVIHSGEFLTDTTPEVVVVNSLTSRLVSIRSAHMNASRVFVVMVDNVVISSTLWSFDPDTQLLTLTDDLPSASYPVTITFAPAKPVTDTYLCNQPFSGSVTRLNEGTPPYPKSQVATATREEVFGSQINDPSDTLGDVDFILNDPYRTVAFTDPEGAIYEELSFCEVDNGGTYGNLSFACDGPAPGCGLVGLELSGSAYYDQFSVPGGPGGPLGAASPVISGTAAFFKQSSILHWSGGQYTDGTLGPGTAILYPNFQGANPNGGAIATRMGLNQETKIELRVTTPYAENVDIPSMIDDNTPPSSPDPDADPNVDGVPGVAGNGAVAVRVIEYGSTGVSRIGPWGGLEALSIDSLLAGGSQLVGNEFTLNGGAQLPGPTVTDSQVEAA